MNPKTSSISITKGDLNMSHIGILRWILPTCPNFIANGRGLSSNSVVFNRMSVRVSDPEKDAPS